MNRVKTQDLPNDVKISAYFSDIKDNTIRKIETLKPIYIKQINKTDVERMDLLLVMEKGQEKNTTFKEQILFNGKNIGVAIYYMYSYEPQGFNIITKQYENYKWVRTKSNPTLSQVWKKPLEYTRIKEFVKLFYGFNEKNPVKISPIDDIAKERQDISLDLLLKIARRDENLGGFQEYCGYEEMYFNRFRKNYSR